jgi:hypothetical protein
MKTFTSALLPVALAVFARGTLADALDDYLTSVCSPNSTAAELPPCVSITNIEGLCQPNGTSPLALEAHAQCMVSKIHEVNLSTHL